MVQDAYSHYEDIEQFMHVEKMKIVASFLKLKESEGGAFSSHTIKTIYSVFILLSYASGLKWPALIAPSTTTFD
ncbi:hypothetical protein KFK09_019260 [Dendrobium nobile]|uniref:Uncharacterized protein n=1 Tax=Dendrobium nobile TaxID=94219 RepID=A0A8T3AZH2_DENNO|nr:hypothetical protein KFK09_019260 [Dendrobium nobile]